MSFAAFFQNRTVRRWRAVLRWVRITLLFSVFLVVATGAYLHLIGLPDFLRLTLLNRLRERGFEVYFTSARLGIGPEVVVDNPTFHRADRPLGPRLSAGRTVIHLDPVLLLRRRVSVDALLISQGRLQLPFSEASGDFLSVNDVFLDLALLPNDTVRLTDGRATFHGIQMALRGTVTNFMATRKLNLWPAAARASPGPNSNSIPAPPGPPQDSLRQFAATLDKIHFQAPPRLDLTLTADGSNPDALRMELRLESAGVQTPWGDAAGLRLLADCARPIQPGSAPWVRARLSASALATPRADGGNLDLTVDISRTAGSNLQAAVSFSVSNFTGRLTGPAETRPLKAASLRWNGSVTLRPSPLALVAVSGKLQADRLGTRWGSADSAALACSAAAVEGRPPAGDSRGFWAKINGWDLDWQADLGRVVTPDAQLERLAGGGSWRAPELVLTTLDAALYGGKLSGRARLDAASRELQAGGRFDFEAHQLSHLLPPAVQSWLNQIQWEHPPAIAFEARLALPDWTRWPSDWAAQLLPSLQVAGDIAAGPSSFRGFSVASLQSRFAWSNQVWDIPGLHLDRPGGGASLDLTGSGGRDGFIASIDSHLDPRDLRPLLPEKQQPLLDHAVFAKADPPRIHAEIRGPWREPEKWVVQARLAATNFTARDQHVDSLETAVEYSNSVARLRDLRLVVKNGEELAAPWAEMDWTSGRISFSNADSTLDPGLATRLLEQHTPGWLKVIGFDTPPAIHAGGSFVPGNPMATDLHFAVSGRDFRWSKLQAGTASGEVHWVAQSVALTNVQADLYDGTLRGWWVFDDKPGRGTECRGHVLLAKIELPLLVKAWSPKSKPVEGVLDANISLTGGNTRDDKSWTGSGRLSVNHAQLWNIRLFGIFSSMLNDIIPGAGNNRAYQAGADFIVTNGMIATDNLQIRSTDFRLLYRGTLNTKKQLDARVEAEVLRDTPVLGRVFSWVFAPLTKLFEYKVGGTLDAPALHPLYIPKVLTSILEPFHKKKPPPASQSPAPDNPPD